MLWKSGAIFVAIGSSRRFAISLPSSSRSITYAHTPSIQSSKSILVPEMSSATASDFQASHKKVTGGGSSFSDSIATAFGASSAVGTHVTNRLGKEDAQIILPYRRTGYNFKVLRPAADLGEMLFFYFRESAVQEEFPKVNVWQQSEYAYEMPTQIVPMQSPSPFWSPVTSKITVIIEPESEKPSSSPIGCPLIDRLPEIRATNRVKRQRRIHVRKKHRKQRLRKLRHIIEKNRDEKEAVKEAQFRKEASMALKNALEFDPEKYIRDTIARAKWRPTPDNTESLRVGIFWTEFMTVEQLFGVPESDYIDKKAGLPSEDDWSKIVELREKYNREYTRKKVNETKE